MKFIKKFLTNNNYFSLEDSRSWRAMLLNFMLIQTILVFFIFGVLNILFFDLPEIALIDFICCVLYSSIFFYFRKSNNLWLSNFLSSIIILIGLSAFIKSIEYQYLSFLWVLAVIPYMFFMNGLLIGAITSLAFAAYHLVALYFLPSAFSTTFGINELANIMGVLLMVVMQITYYEYCRTHNFSLLKEKSVELQRLSLTDALTGLFNRRKLDELLYEKIHDLDNEDGKVYLILIDVDRFKKVNDKYGHLQGDKALIEISNVIQAQTKIFSDCDAGRWGGDEFLIICSNQPYDNILKIADGIRTAIKKNQLISDELGLTLSIGITVSQRVDKGGKLVKLVDNAMYEAKESGGDKVVVNTLIRSVK